LCPLDIKERRERDKEREQHTIRRAGNPFDFPNPSATMKIFYDIDLHHR
jgi:hypothetical protein